MEGSTHSSASGKYLLTVQFRTVIELTELSTTGWALNKAANDICDIPKT